MGKVGVAWPSLTVDPNYPTKGIKLLKLFVDSFTNKLFD